MSGGHVLCVFAPPMKQLYIGFFFLPSIFSHVVTLTNSVLYLWIFLPFQSDMISFLIQRLGKMAQGFSVKKSFVVPNFCASLLSVPVFWKLTTSLIDVELILSMVTYLGDLLQCGYLIRYLSQMVIKVQSDLLIRNPRC